MTKLGPEVPTLCGYSRDLSANICGAAAIVHALFIDVEGQADGVGTGMACSAHADHLIAMADDWHHVRRPCHRGFGAWWMSRTPGTSWCYLPEEDLALHAELAAAGAKPIGANA